MTTLADVTDARFTDDQRATLARFEAAPTPPEVCRTCRGRTRETVGMVCQTCGTDYAALAPQAGDEPCPASGTDPCVLPAGHFGGCLR